MSADAEAAAAAAAAASHTVVPIKSAAEQALLHDGHADIQAVLGLPKVCCARIVIHLNSDLQQAGSISNSIAQQA
jgi:hypothetical protein